ncbi:MAG: chemoreceptor glutamine deamidase CheD [Gammaproteobacteria bacterium]|nr:chemoreceptor glutamine deamidase CheD [Gammaproteobacteria bacterium]
MSRTGKINQFSGLRGIPGFDHINKYWDKSCDMPAAKILPGEYYVTALDEIVVTVLGSCISACIRDVVFGIGGMNHFMLPVSRDEVSSHRGPAFNTTSTRYGNFAMEALINSILKNGGSKENLEVKIFGGGRILEQMTNIGAMNIRFVKEFIKLEQLKLAAEDVGDIYPRKVYYYPLSGRVKLKKLRAVHNNTIVEREVKYLDALEHEKIEGDIDLF